MNSTKKKQDDSTERMKDERIHVKAFGMWLTDTVYAIREATTIPKAREELVGYLDMKPEAESRRTKDKEPSGPYTVYTGLVVGPYRNHAIYDGTCHQVYLPTVCALLNNKPEPVEGLQELAELVKVFKRITTNLTGGFPAKRAMNIKNQRLYSNAVRVLTALGVNFD